jgi:DNA (cytosine-5)-methyltransferase 1
MLIREGKEGGGKGPLVQEDKSATLGCANMQTLFEPFKSDVYEWHNQDSRITGPIDTACTLNTNADGREGHLVAYVAANRPQSSTVRRLTPLECERLQGYPDGWTDIPGASDSNRYKALGNSFAIPCAHFVINGCVEKMKEIIDG